MPYKFDLLIEKEGIVEYLAERNLLGQYKKVKEYLLSGNFNAIHFNKRRPYDNNICYCRINKKYRIWGYVDGTTFVIVKIDDHQ